MTYSLLTLLLLGSTLVSGSQTPSYKRDTGKRGLAYNNVACTSFFSGTKISWAYNWVGSSPSAPSIFEYVPMLHSNESVFTNGWIANVDAAVANGSTHVMSFNEPDQCG
jgi:hypothetical protein